jgi:4-hydroxybenzoate polyprenyltransferase
VPLGCIPKYINTNNILILCLQYNDCSKLDTFVFPTLLLNIGSGYITTISTDNLISNKSFIITCIISQLIMFSSMIINDLFDIKVDKINNPSRPLIKQIIKIYEAIFITILFYCVSIILNNAQINGISKNIGNISILLSILYTPLFKKITFVKNLICAFIVSNTVLYSGLVFNNQYNYELLFTFTKLIFTSSLYIEILKDIQDYDGDKQNKIYTLPIVLGKEKSLNIIFSLIFTVIIDIGLKHLIKKEQIYNLLLTIPLIPMTINLLDIKKNNCTSKSITTALKKTTESLILLLLIIFYIKSSLHI